MISDLSGAGAVAQVAGRAAVLQAATGSAPQVPPAGSASPQQDVHDLAQALLWSADWPPWLEQVLQRVPAGHPSASQVAALLHRAAARNLRDAPGRAAAPDSAATLARSPATLQGASPGRARGGQVARTVLGGVFSLAATSLALVAALAVAALIVLGPEPELRTVPNVAGMSYADAEKRLAESQLTLKLASRDYSDSVPEGNVIRTDPYTGKAVRAGREVRATVSSGRREAKVPSLTGLSLTTATEKLTALNLETGEVKRQSSDKQQDLVMAQDPAPGTIMPRSGKVNLTVSGGPDFGSLKLADGARYLFRTLSVTVPQGKELQLVTVEVRGGGMDRSFQEQLCRSGETLKVDLYGPEGARVRVKLEDERVYSERL